MKRPRVSSSPPIKKEKLEPSSVPNSSRNYSSTQNPPQSSAPIEINHRPMPDGSSSHEVYSRSLPKVSDNQPYF